MAKGNRRKRGQRAREIEQEQQEKREHERIALDEYMARAGRAQNMVVLHTEEGGGNSVMQPDSFVHYSPNAKHDVVLGADDEWKETPEVVDNRHEAFRTAMQKLEEVSKEQAGSAGLGLFQQAAAGSWAAVPDSKPKHDTGPSFPYQQGANQITAEMMKLREQINVLKSEVADCEQALSIKDEIIEELRTTNAALQRRLSVQPVQPKKRTAF